MAKDYQNLLDYAASLQQSAQPQQQMPLDSELPGPQPATGPQTGGGAQGLLDVLGAIGSGLGTVGGTLGTGLLQTLQALPEIAAYRQAALGNPEPLKLMQEQRRQQNLLNQLNSMVQQPEVAPYKEAVQQRLKLGDIEGAQKLVTDLPRQTKFQEMIMSSPSLTDEQKAGIISQGQINLSEALGQYNRILGEQRKELSLQRLKSADEERQAKRLAEQELKAKNPLNILSTAVEEGVLNKDSTQEEITGVLLSRQARLPANDTQRKTQIKQLLESPQLKTLFPNANLSWWEKIFGTSEKAAATTTPTAQPATKTIRLRSASGQEREVADTPANRALAKQKNMQVIQ